MVRAEKSVRFVGSFGRLLDRRAPLNREASIDLGTAELQGSTFAFRSTDAFRFKGALRSTNSAHLVGAQNINKDGAKTRVYIFWLCWSFTACVLNGKPLFACNDVAASSMYIVVCYVNAV